MPTRQFVAIAALFSVSCASALAAQDTDLGGLEWRCIGPHVGVRGCAVAMHPTDRNVFFHSDTFGSGLDDHITAELFYQVQLSENFAITPDLQFIDSPALSPDEDSIWVLGMRLRLAL